MGRILSLPTIIDTPFIFDAIVNIVKNIYEYIIILSNFNSVHL